MSTMSTSVKYGVIVVVALVIIGVVGCFVMRPPSKEGVAGGGVTLNNPTGTTDNSTVLTWSQCTDNDFTSYAIYQSTSSGTLGNQITTITDSTTTYFTVVGLSHNTTYYFTIRVNRATRTYSDSNQANVMTTLSPMVEVKIPIRGLVVFSGYDFGDQVFIDKLKNIGANWVEIVLWVLVTEDGELIPYDDSVPSTPFSIDEIKAQAAGTEGRITSRIKQAHDLGFKVFLCTYHERLGAHHEYGQGLRIDVENFLEEAKKIAVRWAEIAENNSVEMFAPRKELQKFVGQKAALEWDDEILPALRSVYNGDLVRGALVDFIKWDRSGRYAWQGEELPSSFVGWDYLGVDFYGSDTDMFEDLAAMYALFVKKVKELKTQNNLKGVVFEELGEPHSGRENYWNDNSLSGDEIMSRFYQIFFEGGADVIDGFFPWLWQEGDYDLPAGRHEHIAPENVIKQYYTASTITPYSGPMANEYTSTDISYEVTRTLLQDNFNDASNWNLSQNVSVNDGVLEFHGAGPAELSDTSSENWQNYTFSGKFMIVDGTFTITVRSSGSGSYPFIIKPISMIHLVQPDGQGGFMAARETHFLVEYDKWHNFTVVAKDNLLQLFIDNDKALEYLDSTPLLNGTVCFYGDGRAFVDNVVIQEIQ